NPRQPFIDGKRARIADRPRREYSPTTRRVEGHHFSAALLWIKPLGKQSDILWRACRDLVGFVARRAAGATPVQAFASEEVAGAQASPLEGPVTGVDHAVGSACHDAGRIEDNAQEIRFRFTAFCKTAFCADAFGPKAGEHAVVHNHRAII